PAEVKEERVRQLVRLSKDLTLAYASRFVGRILPVVVESSFDDRRAEDGKMLLTGHADNYLEMVFAADPSMVGQLVEVRLEDPGAERSFGSVVRQISFAPQEDQELVRADRRAETTGGIFPIALEG
ncbi:MAG TPA: tRNA (N(6)-L-threonylcarbamoyladenosine(37)-C(2))-methylthiotransferase MtaB, partial [Alicyclobacillus sp.]|nr:tRNA (N(6)-L-threonylcarbamoyladenosine(37)-C(2))-methylthiotransferase MtaB [Alicyclobacillus sp.]